MISLNIMIAIIGLALLFLSVLIEAYMYLDSNHWNGRRTTALLAGILLSLSIITFAFSGVFLLIVVSVVGLYKIVNITRVYISRLEENRLLSVSRRSFIVLTLLQILFVVIWLLDYATFNKLIDIQEAISIMIVAGFISSLVIATTTLIKIIRSNPKPKANLADSELPSVSVCIAARNETPKLTACIKSALADNYPKMEVLVLDDDSQDSTAEIIKSFAHDGVRFVKQDRLNGKWLAKNKAYQTLLEQSSGKIIFYIGVDVRLHKDSIRNLIEQFNKQDIAMMTVLPKRTKSGLVAAFIQPMRYWKELALPKAILKRQPALSTCWLVKRSDLQKIEGFNSYKRSIIPEEHLAKLFGSRNEYSYIRTDKKALVTTHKSFFNQWDTSIRTSYPHTHYRPETVLMQSTMLAILVVAPFILFLGLFFGWLEPPYNYLVIITTVLYLVSHIAISLVTNPVAAFLAPINFPIVISIDILATHISMYKYEFRKVIWKGRDIAPKNLKTYKSLPKI